MTWPARRFISRCALAGTLVTLMLVAGSSTASAHSYFVQSDPADGSILAQSPQKVVLVFSSAVAANFTSIQLVEAGGARYTPTSVLAYPGHSDIVVVNLPEIPQGSYRLTFVTRDSVDLHQTSGTIVFGVGMAPPTTAPTPKPLPAQPAEFLLRWLALAGLSAILGGVSFALLVIVRLPTAELVRAHVQRLLLGVALLGTVLVVAGQTGLLALRASSLGPVVPSAGRLLAGSELGTRWLVTVLLALGLAALLVTLRRAARQKQVPSLSREIRTLGAWSLLSTQVRVLVLCLGLTGALAYSSHVTGTAGTSITGLTLLTVHLGAMGVWVGGLLALGLALLALRRAEGRLSKGAVMALVVGFGPIAALGFAALAATGLLLSGMQVATITALLSTQYGLVLIAKVALIGLVAVFGLRHAMWTWRGLARRGPWLGRIPRRLPLTLALETSGALVAVLLASVLGASAPARGPQFESLSRGPTLTQATGDHDGLLLTLSVKPNRAGPNLIGVHVVSTRRPVLAPVQRVTVTVMRPGEVPLALGTTSSGSLYDGGSVQLAAGDVTFTVRVERQGIADTVETVPWEVTAAEVPRAPVVLSNQTVAPLADIAAVLVVLIAIALLAAGVVRRRRAAKRPSLHELVQRARRYEREQSEWRGAMPRFRRRSVVATGHRLTPPRSAGRRRPGAKRSR